MKILTDFLDSSNLEWQPTRYLVSVTKSKKVIFERFEFNTREINQTIDSLQNAGELIGVEIMEFVNFLVACCSRTCAFVGYDNKSMTRQRVVNLGEEATSIFYNFQLAMFGTLDSSKNSIALYPL